jgi:hypothetical protein
MQQWHSAHVPLLAILVGVLGSVAADRVATLSIGCLHGVPGWERLANPTPSGVNQAPASSNLGVGSNPVLKVIITFACSTFHTLLRSSVENGDDRSLGG